MPQLRRTRGASRRPISIGGDAVSFNWWRESEPDETSAQAIVDRVQAEWRAERQRLAAVSDGDGGAGLGAHAAPDEELTIEQAHRETQTHRNCLAEECPKKRAAFQRLVKAGRVVPDSARSEAYMRQVVPPRKES